MDQCLDTDLDNLEAEEGRAGELLAGRREENERVDQKITSELTAINKRSKFQISCFRRRRSLSTGSWRDRRLWLLPPMQTVHPSKARQHQLGNTSAFKVHISACLYCAKQKIGKKCKSSCGWGVGCDDCVLRGRVCELPLFEEDGTMYKIVLPAVEMI
jgi:hypothetical protein